MRAVIQRVSSAAVEVDGAIVGAIDTGLVILLGIGADDTAAEARLLAAKTVDLRIFADDEGKFNRSLRDIGGAALVVSQFTLYADTRKGRRPSFTAAAPPDVAATLVDCYADAIRTAGISVATGVFGAMMRVNLVNEGPVTIILDTATWHQPRRRT
jgi:D-aminoacyl-tRNA deacylase